MATVVHKREVEVRERKAGRRVVRYEVRSYPVELTTYPDGTVLKSVLLTTLLEPPLAVFEVGVGTPKAARAKAEAAATEWRVKFAAEGRASC